MHEILVPDASVLVSGRLTHLVETGELRDVDIVVPEAVLAQLEYNAVEGRESGVTGIDEIEHLQRLAETEPIRIFFQGERPHPRSLDNETELRGLIRQVTEHEGGTLVTSDRVQAHVSRARGLEVWYLHPWGDQEEPDPDDLELFGYFDDETMSVHLKADCRPIVKRGTPGTMQLQRLGEALMTHEAISRMAREIIEAARRDPDSFVEIERPGATVCQLGPVRVAISRPPFSDGIEITATRPVVRLGLEDYDLPGEILQRTIDGSRGIFISGPPGSGKSTFAQALADRLHEEDTVVKTMESPRDLQVDPEITQYAPLDGSMELTGDVLLLVRPDYVIYDEVRKTEDFSTFADMRLAGVGLVGVTHANRAIDAVQRLLGRVELGMIPQVVDTVVHIHQGQIDQILELELTVKVPAGMTEQDLARPIVVVKDHKTKRASYEIYTYGEQTVVMPIEKIGQGGQADKRDKLAGDQLAYQLNRHIEGKFDVEMTSANRATIYVEDWEIGNVIGSGGSNVKRLENQVGLKLDIRTFAERREEQRSQGGGNASPSGGDGGSHAGGRGDSDGGGGGGGGGGDWAASGAHGYQEIRPQPRQSRKNLVLVLDPELAGDNGQVCIEDEVLFEATVGRNGEIRVRRKSREGQELERAFADGRDVVVRI